MSVTVVFLALCATLWLYVYLDRLKFYRFAKKVGGPWGPPLIGVVHRFLNMNDILYNLPKFSRESKSTFFWVLIRPILYTYDPEKIKKILISPDCINKSVIYDVIDKELGSGILSSSSPIWEKHRKLLNPCFKHKILLSFFSIFNKETDDFLPKLDKLVGHGENDLWLLLEMFVLQTSFATTVGEQVSQTVRKDNTFISHVERYLNTVFERTVNLLMRYDITFRFNKSYKEYKESKNIVRSFVRNLLSEKLAEVEGKCQQDVNKNIVAPDDSKDTVQGAFIDQAIDMIRNNVLSWQEVCNEAYVIVAATFEITAVTLRNLLMLMAMHPEYQEKMYEEVVSIFPKQNFDVDFEHLADLVYMEMFIKETLRVAPSVPFISRTVSKDLKVEDDLWIPKGTLILIDLFNLHRCKEFWGPNADKFDPDNFLPENQHGKHPYSYIPFSKGSRNCIGGRYGMLFLKVALSKIIRNYRFSTSFRYEDLKYVPHVSLKLDVSPKLEIHRR